VPVLLPRVTPTGLRRLLIFACGHDCKVKEGPCDPAHECPDGGPLANTLCKRAVVVPAADAKANAPSLGEQGVDLSDDEEMIEVKVSEHSCVVDPLLPSPLPGYCPLTTRR